ncbi:hypothetical protein BGZ83_002644, partial [Gryganskiella cystojenkinii]
KGVEFRWTDYAEALGRAFGVILVIPESFVDHPEFSEDDPGKVKTVRLSPRFGTDCVPESQWQLALL